MEPMAREEGSEARLAEIPGGPLTIDGDPAGLFGVVGLNNLDAASLEI